MIKYVGNLILLIWIHTAINLSWTIPEDGVIVAGEATIIATPNKLLIEQTSAKTIIDWRTFNIAPHEHTQFIQPAADAIALNRVFSTTASTIDGKLTANGKIIILNQHGVLFGEQAKVDVNALLATTANIPAESFWQQPAKGNGSLAFNIPGDPNAKIINAGEIVANGLVGLVAPQVINQGVITAKAGKVHLASGDLVNVDLYGDDLIKIAVTEKLSAAVANESTQQIIINAGKIAAPAGKILLTAASGRELINSLIVNTGELVATSIAKVQGEILICGYGSNAVAQNITANKGKIAGDAQVLISGLVDVSGVQPGERAGKITITGDHVGLFASTMLHASGHTGKYATTVPGKRFMPRAGAAGGEILIGGDYLGQGAVPTAKNVYVDPLALIITDALELGDAGRSIFWADDTTIFYGKVLARGLGGQEVDPVTGHALKSILANFGDGGFVETSGKKQLVAEGEVDLTTSNGAVGTYFLDPSEINIYGNFDPKFRSTDGTVDLSANLKMWLDFADPAKVTLRYISKTTLTAAASAGATTLTVGSITGLTNGARIYLGASIANTLASVVETASGQAANGSNIYTISAVPSGTTVTITPPLKISYASGTALCQGYISQVTDKSTAVANHASQPDANQVNMPLWLSNGLNNLGASVFDGTDDYLNIPISLMATQSEFTYLATVKDLSSPTWSRVFDFGKDSSTGFTYMHFKAANTATGPRFGSYKPPVSLAIEFSISMVNQYGLIVALMNSSSARGYINGAIAGSTTGTFPLPKDITQVNHYLGKALVVNDPYFKGNFLEVMEYNLCLSDLVRSLIEQYQAAKWNMTISGAPSTTYAAGATGSSSFTADYLKQLSTSADLTLTADNIKLDLKTGQLTVADGRNITITANSSLSATSSGTILTKKTTTGGNIVITSNATTGTVDLSNLILNAQNGGKVTITTNSSTKVGTITAGSILTEVKGATCDLTIPLSKSLTVSDANNSLILVAGRNFKNLNAAGTAVLNIPATNARWQIYSATYRGNQGTGMVYLGNSMSKYTTAYAAGVNPTELGNLLIYQAAAAGTLTIVPDFSGINLVYGAAVPNFSSIPFTLTGYIAPDVASADVLTGAPSYSTNYVQGNGVGSYDVTISRATLESSLGYDIVGQVKNNVLIVGKRPVVLTPSAGQTKIYGNADPSLTYTITSGSLYGSDQLTGNLTINSAKDVGIYPIELGSVAVAGTIKDHYALSLQLVNFTITPKELTVNLIDPLKVYDGDNLIYLKPENYSLTGGTVYNDLVELNYPKYGVFADPNIGTNKLVTVSGLGLVAADLNTKVSNYYVANTKTFNNGQIVSDQLQGNYLNKDVTGDLVTDNVLITNLKLYGEDAANYQLESMAVTLDGDLTQKLVAVFFDNTKQIIKEYDGNLNATLALENYFIRAVDQSLDPQGNILTTFSDPGILSQDLANVTLTNFELGQFDTIWVGNGKNITVNNLTLTGSAAKNYQLYATTVTGSIGKIQPRALSVSLVVDPAAPVTKVYNGALFATLTKGNYLFDRIVNNDEVGIQNFAAGVYDNINVGTNKQVTVTNLSLAGAQSANYQLKTLTATAVFGTITAKPIITNLRGVISKQYDGTATVNLPLDHKLDPSNYYFTSMINNAGAEPLLDLAPIIVGDQLELTAAAGNYLNDLGEVDRNVAAQKPVRLTGLELLGASKINYVLTATTVTTAENLKVGKITPKPLSLELVGTVSKGYNGRADDASLTAANYNLLEVVEIAGNKDQVTLINWPVQGSYSDPKAGINKLVTVHCQDLGLTGADQNNYSISTGAFTLQKNIGIINKKILEIELKAKVSKIYDGDQQAQVTADNYGLTGIVPGDQIYLANY